MTKCKTLNIKIHELLHVMIAIDTSQTTAVFLQGVEMRTLATPLK